MRHTGFLLIMTLALLGQARASGVLSIAGYTTVDQQVFGPSLKRIAYDPESGTHILWKDVSQIGAYNFYDRVTGAWHWSNGTPVFDRRVGLGNMAINPLDNLPTISGSFLDGGVHHAIYAYDSAVGRGKFTSEENPAPYELEWNLNAFSNTGHHQFAALRHDTIVHHRSGYPTNLGKIGQFPSHNIAGSRANARLAIFWTRNEAPNAGDLYLRRSTNGGSGWRDTIVPSRAIPAAFRNTFLGANGEFDSRGELHIVGNTYNGSNSYSSDLWHYCEADTPNWSLIHHYAAPQSGSLPDLALIAGRPSIGEDSVTGDLFVVWEQFDPTNVEPTTGILRSDIWAARSQDHGITWGLPVRLTEPDMTSKCYPNLAVIVDDNLHIAFPIDSIAGNSAEGQGRVTNNPVVYLRYPSSLIPGAVTEDRERTVAGRGSLTAYPNPFHERISFEIASNCSRPGIRIFSSTGDFVRELVAQHSAIRASRCRLTWDCTDQSGLPAPNGIYFAVLSGVSLRSQPSRLMITRLR
jgi:hypothetical protein